MHEYTKNLSNIASKSGGKSIFTALFSKTGATFLEIL